MECARDTRLDLDVAQDGRATLVRNGSTVGDEIRTEDVSAATSRVAAVPELREWLVGLQRDFGERFGGVVEGRDIGSVVFPETPHKFFLEAPLAVRARRRTAQLDKARACAGEEAVLDSILRDLEKRDRQDREREMSPLRVDDSYTVVDTGERTVDEVVDHLAARVAATMEQRR